MCFRKSAHPIIFNRFCWTILALYPLINSCASKQVAPAEIVLKPTLPKEFTSIPDVFEGESLIPLASSDEIIHGTNVGRNDPFLPPQISSDELSVPNAFKFHGLIASEDNVDAFVSYKNLKGTIKSGDIGGETTELLPTGWVVSNVNKDRSVLVLSFDKNSVEIELFSK